MADPERLPILSSGEDGTPPGRIPEFGHVPDSEQEQADWDADMEEGRG